MPGAFPTTRVTDRLSPRNAETNEFPSARAGIPPVLPVAHPQPTSQPLFQEVADQHNLEPPTSDEDEKLSLTKHFWADHRELAPVVDTFLELKAQSKLLGFFNNLAVPHRAAGRL